MNAQHSTQSSIRSLFEYPAVILAGGLGNRLRSAFPDGPKCLAPVAGLPFLDYLIRLLQGFGFADIVLCVGYRASDIQERYKDGADRGLHITYSIEETHLGTAGAVKNAESLLHGETFLVLNGDSFVDADLAGLVRFHRHCRALATLTLVPAPSG
jgi:NDP-sugar pyrophosphorylase family protein